MFPQLIIIEDDAELMTIYRRGFHDRGFTDLVSIANTDRVGDEVAQCYVRPTLLLCDYYVHPTSPSRFLPELRLRGIEMPAVLVSGRIRAEQINDLTLVYPIRGFFEKSPQVSQLIAAIAKQLIDLGPEANAAWERRQLHHEVNRFLEGRSTAECAALLKLMGMEEVKIIATEVGLGLNLTYGLRKEMLHFLGKTCAPPRYTALADALHARLIQGAGTVAPKVA